MCSSWAPAPLRLPRSQLLFAQSFHLSSSQDEASAQLRLMLSVVGLISPRYRSTDEREAPTAIVTNRKRSNIDKINAPHEWNTMCNEITPLFTNRINHRRRDTMLSSCWDENSFGRISCAAATGAVLFGAHSPFKTMSKLTEHWST